MLLDMCLPKLDIYQVTVAQNRFNSHTNSRGPDFFKKKKNVLPDIGPEIHLVRRNISSTGQSARA